MKQLIQNFKSGKLYIDEVPLPTLTKGFVLIENKFSLISAGTERSTVKVGKASILGKAKLRPDLVKQVLLNLKKEGLKATLNKVKTKLDTPKALGYSSAGIVLASMDTNGFFQPGDRVACGGQDFASHAEIISVPQNLVVKVPDNVSFEEASFTTVGAIALQGVRQANPSIGENICVIGLGLIGQITCQILKANGCNVFGIDVSPDMVNLANKMGVAKAVIRNNDSLLTLLENYSKGRGFDKVIITASSSTNDPIVLATKILRKKGVIVLVGAVPIEIPREPDFYKKELEFKISTSYGPGRYDPKYELEGIDYPFGYVRWTEQRNMEAFLNLISNGYLNLKPLITHIFDISEAIKAYDIILGKKREKYIGILIKYNENKEKYSSLIKINKDKHLKKDDEINVGFIGAGSFAQNYLIPYVKDLANLITVVTKTGISSKNVAEKFDFRYCSTDIEDILSNKNINVVFIATQHNTHAEYVIKSLEADKHVFVEKPLALNKEELEKVLKTYKKSNKILMVGFNRRFAPISLILKEEFSNNFPIVMNFRINAGFIPKEHWTQTEAGGGRIIGEICHFIDLMQFFTNSIPIKVFAECINSENEQIKNEDNVIITIKFKNGSIGSVVYIANGDKSMPKERLEISGGGKIAVINDFKEGEIYKNNRLKRIKLSGKGHKQEIINFFDAIKNGKESPINFMSLYYTTLTTFKIIDSLKTGLPQEIIL